LPINQGQFSEVGFWAFADEVTVIAKILEQKTSEASVKTAIATVKILRK
jgi:hypothetical protein